MTTSPEWGEPLTGPQMKALREAGMPGDVLVRCTANVLPDEDLAHRWCFNLMGAVYRTPANDPSYLCHVHNTANGDDMVPHYGSGKPADWDPSKPVLVLDDGESRARCGKNLIGKCWEECSGSFVRIIGYHALPKQEEAADDEARLAAYNDAHETAISMGYPSLTEALEHLDELRPTPVDPDLIEAREIVASVDPGAEGEAYDAEVRAGLQDHEWGVRAALAAIKRGRELAEQSK